MQRIFGYSWFSFPSGKLACCIVHLCKSIRFLIYRIRELKINIPKLIIKSYSMGLLAMKRTRNMQWQEKSNLFFSFQVNWKFNALFMDCEQWRISLPSFLNINHGQGQLYIFWDSLSWLPPLFSLVGILWWIEENQQSFVGRYLIYFI